MLLSQHVHIRIRVTFQLQIILLDMKSTLAAITAQTMKAVNSTETVLPITQITKRQSYPYRKATTALLIMTFFGLNPNDQLVHENSNQDHQMLGRNNLLQQSWPIYPGFRPTNYQEENYLKTKEKGIAEQSQGQPNKASSNVTKVLITALSAAT